MPQEAAHGLIFLDTETTGREAHDRIFQLAFRYEGQTEAGLCKPPVPVSFEAMEVTHVTNEMLADKPPFQELPAVQKLKHILEKDAPIVVAHNAPFDIAMLAKEGVVVPHYIDTLRVAKHLDPEEKLPNYRLQFLRYALGLSVPPDIKAHDALADVFVLEALFARLFAKLAKLHPQKSAQEIKHLMQELSIKPRLLKYLRFGKYKDKTFAEVAKTDPDYLHWLLREKEKDLQHGTYDKMAAEDMIFTIKKHLGVS